MKKFSFILLISLILSLFCGVIASAEMITAMAAEINPEHPENTASHARILSYNEADNTLTVELINREVFSSEEMLSLQPGDSIYTGGEEILIESVTPTDLCGDVLLFNDGDLLFFGERDGYYRMVDEDCYLWQVIAVMECPVKDHLLLLDGIDDTSGDMLALPTVHTAGQLTAKLLAEQASDLYHVGFAADNVYVIFDGEGELAVIHRFYVPWQ